MTTPTTPKMTKLARISLFITGLTTNPPTGSKSIVLLGQALTPVQLIALLNTLVAALQAVANAKVAYSKAVAAAKALLVTRAALLSALRSALILAYGSDAQGLAACGIVVKPRAKRSGQQNTVIAAKAKATRKANGTGKKAAQPTITITDPTGQVMDAEGNVQASTPAPVAPVGVVAPAAAGAAPVSAVIAK